MKFPTYPVLDGERLNLRGRRKCLACRPRRRLRAPRRKVERTRQEKTCEACGARFPAKAMIDGVMRDLHRRRFCPKCSPFGAHNTSRQAPGPLSDARTRKVRARRLGSWLRYGRERRRKRKRELVSAFGGACIECGYARAVAALEFHHRDPSTKDFAIARFTGSDARLMAEAAKCDLLCANCHRRRHAAVDEHRDPSADLARRRLKQRAVELLGGRCAGCDREHVPSVFEFHHRDGAAKDFGISEDGRIRSWEVIETELAKCVLLCANCHRETHAGLREVDAALMGLAEGRSLYEVAA